MLAMISLCHLESQTRVSVTTENKGNTEPVRITGFARMAEYHENDQEQYRYS